MRIVITLVTAVLAAAMAVAGGGDHPAVANAAAANAAAADAAADAAAPCPPEPGHTASSSLTRTPASPLGISVSPLGTSIPRLGTSAGAGSVWTWPLGAPLGAPLKVEGSGAPVILRPFEPPAHRWDPGHRGVDLAGAVGEPVLAAGAGVVLFAGRVVDQGVVVVGHGALRTSYEPVSTLVTVGEPVEAGQTLGTLDSGHCAQAACLHWGLLTGHDHATVYYDPLLLLGCGAVRLEPLG